MIHPQRLKLTAAVFGLVLATPLLASPARRHAAAPISDIPQVQATLTGTVTDSDTGAPVINADVSANNGRTFTDAKGNYSFNAYSLPKQVLVTVTRTGYETASQGVALTQDTASVINFKLKAKATLTVRATDGTVYSLDFDSAQFGYYTPFSSPPRFDFANLCKTDGTAFTPSRDDFVRILGPAKPVTNSACCTIGPVMQATAVMKSGETLLVNFADSCFGSAALFIGRDHASGQYKYLDFKDIAEIVFR